MLTATVNIYVYHCVMCGRKKAVTVKFVLGKRQCLPAVIGYQSNGRVMCQIKFIVDDQHNHCLLYTTVGNDTMY